MRVTPDVARAGPTSARRRREKRIRSLFRHEQMAIKMAVVTAQHHSAQRCCTIASQTVVEYVDPAPVVPAPVTEFVATAPAVTYAAPAPVVGYDAPAPAVTYAPPAPVIGFVAPAPSVTFAAPAPVFEYVAPAPVLGFAPAPAVSFVAPGQQLRPASTAAAVTTGVNLDAEFVVSASQVVGSLSHGEVFAVPVFHQVHHVPLAGGGLPENLVDLPVVPKQVDFLRVVARRPPPLVDVMHVLTCTSAPHGGPWRARTVGAAPRSSCAGSDGPFCGAPQPRGRRVGRRSACGSLPPGSRAGCRSAQDQPRRHPSPHLGS